jgi:hypothetical protein
MISPSAREAEAACLSSLEGALTAGTMPELGSYAVEVLDSALHALVKRHGAAAAPLLRVIADRARAKAVRKSARRALYRLGQAGLEVPPTPPPSAPVVRRVTERPIRAWLSAIDGTGSRAVWILFEGGLGGQLQLCSLILNDEVGVLEAAGGSITKKRLEAELRLLREHQKLPWVDTDPARACALVHESLALHARMATEPPPEFSRWRRLFDPPGAATPAAELDPAPGADSAAAVERSAELLELPEFAGWFVDPEQIHEDALALLQARESRLVVSDQIKSEREAAIVDAVVDKLFTGEARRRWARRLTEMALIFQATGRDQPARLATATAAALVDEAQVARHLPFVRALALRGLMMGAEVALGRARLADVSRAPTPRKTRP